MVRKMIALRMFLTLTLVSSFLLPGYGQEESPSPEKLLLKDFRPQSVYKVPKTPIERAKYPVIDLHSHPYAKSLEAVAEWVEIMNAKGIDKTVIMTYAYGPRFDSLAAVYGQYPDRFILFCGFDYRGYDEPGYGPAAVAELAHCFEKGARGVGELGDKGKGLFYSKPPAYGMHIDDARMDPLLEKCGELGIPVSIHVAEPIWMYEPMDATNDGLMNAYTWRLDNQEGILNHDEMVQTLARAVARHPGTNFIACHLANCSYDLSKIGDLFDTYPNLYGDIGARFGEFSPTPRATKAFFEQYQDRIVYGTDMGYQPDMYEITFRILESQDEHFYDHGRFSYHWPLYGLGISDQALEKIYRLNALELLNLDQPKTDGQ